MNEKSWGKSYIPANIKTDEEVMLQGPFCDIWLRKYGFDFWECVVKLKKIISGFIDSSSNLLLRKQSNNIK